MKSKTFLFLFPLIVWNTACTKQNIRDYYFPVLDLQAGKVYVYDLPAGDSSAPDYWYYRGFVRDSGIFLSGTYYDPQFEIRQIIREKLVSGGSLMRDYFIYEADTSRNTLTRIQADITAPTVFPFQVQDSLGVFLFSLSYAPPSTRNAQIYVIRNRRYGGKGPDFELNGKRYPTIRFFLREAVGYEKEGAAEIEGAGEEWYAKNIGLVYRRVFYGGENGFEKAFQLKEIIEMTELEKRAEGVLLEQDSTLF